MLSGLLESHCKTLRKQLWSQRGWPLLECARLVPLPLHLSEHGAVTGFKLQQFLAAPASTDACELQQRCKKARNAARITFGTPQPLTGQGASVAAFRRMLFTA